MKESPDTRAMLACIGDEARYLAVQTLSRGECCVTDLARRIGRSQSCTTRHLQALRRGGIVRRERQGKRVVFTLRLEDPRVRSLVEFAVDNPPAPPRSRARGAGTTRRAPPPAPRRPAPTHGSLEPDPAGPAARDTTAPDPRAGAEAPTEASRQPPEVGDDPGGGAGRPPGYQDLEDFLL